MANGTTNQMGSAQEAGRPQPATTVEASGGPFIRHSQPGMAPIYNVSGTTFGSVVTQPLVARPGYFRALRVTQTVTGGTGVAATYGADAPFSLSSLTQFKDAFGTPLIVAPGYEVAQLINTFSGGFGALNGTNVNANLPSAAAFSTAGNGSVSFALPLEFAKAYGTLSAANASLLPTLQFNYNAAATFYTVQPSGGTPVISTQVDASFYWLPEGAAVEPPGLGTTRQWILQQANPTIAASGSSRLQFPRLGGYLDTIIMEIRDSTGARNGGYWPSRLQLYVDGVPMIDATINELQDDQAIAYGLTPAQLGWVAGAAVAPSFANQNLGGVLAVSRKNSLMQTNLGLLDTGETYLSSNPGTLLEANFAPAGAGSNSPATMNVLVGQIVPTGAIIQGLPEL